MIHRPSPRVACRPGLSLLEITIVIAAVLSLIGILFIGASAWKRGADRSGCVLTLRNIQMATRSYQNLYGYSPGSQPLPVDGGQDIARHLHRKGYIEQKLLDQALGLAACPAGGGYNRPAPQMFPPHGELYMSCSLGESDEHAPESHADW